MDAQRLQQLKMELESEREELVKKIASLEKIKDFGDDVDSLEEEADESEEYSNQLSVAMTLKGRVADIDMALRKIEAGTYGTCERCGKQISEELLNIAPESHLCQDCKMRSQSTNASESTK